MGGGGLSREIGGNKKKNIKKLRKKARETLNMDKKGICFSYTSDFHLVWMMTGAFLILQRDLEILASRCD